MTTTTTANRLSQLKATVGSLGHAIHHLRGAGAYPECLSDLERIHTVLTCGVQRLEQPAPAPVAPSAAQVTTAPVLLAQPAIPADDVLATLGKAELLTLCQANHITPLMGAGASTLRRQLAGARSGKPATPVVVSPSPVQAKPATPPAPVAVTPAAAPAPVVAADKAVVDVRTAIEIGTLAALAHGCKVAGIVAEKSDSGTMRRALQAWLTSQDVAYAASKAPAVAAQPAPTSPASEPSEKAKGLAEYHRLKADCKAQGLATDGTTKQLKDRLALASLGRPATIPASTPVHPAARSALYVPDGNGGFVVATVEEVFRLLDSMTAPKGTAKPAAGSVVRAA